MRKARPVPPLPRKEGDLEYFLVQEGLEIEW